MYEIILCELKDCRDHYRTNSMQSGYYFIVYMFYDFMSHVYENVGSHCCKGDIVKMH